MTAVEQQQCQLAERYRELRRELVELHQLLWPPDREGPYRKTRRPDVGGSALIPAPLPNAQLVRGRDLRRAVLASLAHAGRSLTLTEIHRSLHLSGYQLGSDNPVKQLGDALRYEELQGRVRRVERGTYSLR